MLEFIIMAAAGAVFFGLFFLITALKEKGTATRPPIHTCGQNHGCRCQGGIDRDQTVDKNCAKHKNNGAFPS